MTQLCFHIQFIFHSKFSKHFFGFISSEYRVSLKKGTLAIFVFFCSRRQILLFTCVLESEFQSRFIWPIISIQNPNCPKNAKSASVDLSFGMFFYECGILQIQNTFPRVYNALHNPHPYLMSAIFIQCLFRKNSDVLGI